MAAMPVTSDALTEMDNQDTSTLPHQFVCSLCCDNVSTDESTTLTACNHQGCKVCMTKWIEKLEYSSQVTSPTCPFCRSSIHDVEVIAILGRPFKEREAPTRPDIDEIDELTLQWLTEQTTLCPGCGSRVEKDNGCDHMTCLCGCEFCFECGRVRCLCSNGGGTTYGAEEEPIRDANGIANLRLCIQRRNGRAIRIERHCRRCKNMIEEENRWSSNYERVRNIYCDRDDSAFAYNSCDGRWLFSCRKRSRSVVMLMQQRNSLSVHLQRYNSETLDQHSIPVYPSWLFENEGQDAQLRALHQLFVGIKAALFASAQKKKGTAGTSRIFFIFSGEIRDMSIVQISVASRCAQSYSQSHSSLAVTSPTHNVIASSSLLPFIFITAEFDRICNTY
eukprot:CAMPEP_0201666856 /NCGR_PEP_ID=MMETSP0494-20130426/10372_1 /ASSEMBLY_ACC=CAM_ASM_000839 /TAXON_ID=420259 /ORGANISM="Thalassiosira gravida, Strain GMp14c1" /LENGTH=390 /DNA_ID=CAMNT_0048146391 /DNA_START=40 /DNA_END=1213 /DNA_ORIENTATION=+